MIVELIRTFASWSLIFPATFLAGQSAHFMVETKNERLRGILYCGVGLGILSYGVVMLSALRLLSPHVIWIALVAVLLLRIRILPQWIQWLKAILHTFTETKGRRNLFLSFLTATTLLVTLMGTLSPEVGGDALAYQLNLPKIFLKLGSVSPLYYDNNSYFPMFLNRLYLIGLATGGQLSAKLFHFFTGFLLFLTVRELAMEEMRDRMIGGFVALVVLLTPCVNNLMSTTYIDVGVAFYGFLAFVVLLEALNTLTMKSFFLSGLLGGFCVSIKYIGMIGIFALMAVWLVNIKKFGSARSFLKMCGAWLAGFLLPSLYWMIRNWSMTGNPVFPYLASVFGTDDYLIRDYNKYGSGSGFFDFLALFWNLSVNPVAFGNFSDRIGVFYLFLVPFLIIAAFKNSSARNYLIFAFVCLALWFQMAQLSRYLLPMLPAIAVGSASGIRQAAMGLSKMMKQVGIGLGFAVLILYLAAAVLHYRFSYRLFTGVWTFEEYLNKLERTWPIATWINQKLPDNSKILIESEPSLFYMDRPILRDRFLRYQTHYDRKKWKPNSFYQFLKSHEVTHLLLSGPVSSIDQQDSNVKQLSTSSYANLMHEVTSDNIRGEQYLYRLYELV